MEKTQKVTGLDYFFIEILVFIGGIAKEAVPPLLIPLRGLSVPAGSGQVFLRHPETTIYRCFLSDLTDFIAFCRAGPSLQRHLKQAVPLIKDRQQEINPAKADCRYRAPLAPRLAQPQLSCYLERRSLSIENAMAPYHNAMAFLRSEL
jgi:hypothetical protein